jgi:SacI restriction endonuclease
VDVESLGGFVAVEQSNRVLAPVASEVAVVAIDHRQACSHVAGEVEGGDAGTEGEGRERVPEIVDAAKRRDPGRLLCRPPRAVPEVVEVEIAAIADGNRSELSGSGRRTSSRAASAIACWGTARPSVAFIAAVGSVLLAKATDPQIDALVIQEREGSAGAFSLRGPAKVLGTKRHAYGYDIGSSSDREPINHGTLIGSTRWDVALHRITPRHKAFFQVILQWLRDVNVLTKEQALEALAAYIRVRQTVVPGASVAELPKSLIQVPALTDLVDVLEGFVSADPEEVPGGWRLSRRRFVLPGSRRIFPLGTIRDGLACRSSAPASSCSHLRLRKRTRARLSRTRSPATLRRTELGVRCLPSCVQVFLSGSIAQA